MEQLKERLHHLRGETLVLSSFVQEDRAETTCILPRSGRIMSPGQINKVVMRRDPLNERTYKYIRIEEAEKRAKKRRGNRPEEEARRSCPDLKRRSALDRIWASDWGYSKDDLPLRERPEFPDLSFSKLDFERINFPHEDPLVIAPVFSNSGGTNGRRHSQLCRHPISGRMG
ncbi:hypothetical protein LIER_25378 [Lithospermum erythrorhizon]|uniref:Uncharacterized protein n=1 Tax=Lithospermum erythrorhizon TaxID=34254 RepID=A0AAV3R4I2_LITER